MHSNSRGRLSRPLAVVSFAAVLVGTLVACGGGGYGGGGSSTPVYAAPTIGGSASVTGTATANRTITLTATPTAATGLTVTRVDFLIDGTSVGSATAAPFTTNWDTTTVADGAHAYTAKVTDSQSQTATSTAVTINVLNKPAFTPALAPAQVVPAPTSTATGTSNITVNLASGATTGSITVTGVAATGASINSGFAGSNGASVIALTQNATTATEWDVPASSLLTADQVTALLQGKLYITVATAANANGELRGQILPANVTVVFNVLAGTQEVPAVTITAAGTVATTVDSAGNIATVEVNSTGVDDATSAEVDAAAQGATGPKLFDLTKDTVNLGHWSKELATVTAANVTDFTGGKWYVNVITPAQATGAIRGQITTGAITPPAAAPTLTQMQATIFSHCVGCHTGGGAALPQSMNLTTAANTFSNIVGVASVEQPALKRVTANDADNSYVIQKLEGLGSITGSRMPLGGPFFDQPTIDQLKAWINAGAQNN